MGESKHRPAREAVALDRCHGRDPGTEEGGEQSLGLIEGFLDPIRVRLEPLEIEAVGPDLSTRHGDQRPRRRCRFDLREQLLDHGVPIRVEPILSVAEIEQINVALLPQGRQSLTL